VDVFDEEYVRQLATFHRRFGVRWHSDHVSFLQVRGRTGRVHNAGVAVPVCFDYEMLDLFVNRVLRVQETVGLPFLLENSACYVDFPEQDLTEAEFLNALTARTGCGLLLDLNNVYVSAVNHRTEPMAYLDQFPMEHVGEIHLGDSLRKQVYLGLAGTPTIQQGSFEFKPTGAWIGALPIHPKLLQVSGLLQNYFGSLFNKLDTERDALNKLTSVTVSSGKAVLNYQPPVGK
jgi:hypothetical protein